MTTTHHGEIWTAEEIDFAKEFRGECTAREVGEALGRTVEAVHSLYRLIDRGMRDTAGRKRHTPEPAGFALQFAKGWQDRMLQPPTGW